MRVFQGGRMDRCFVVVAVACLVGVVLAVGADRAQAQIGSMDRTSTASHEDVAASMAVSMQAPMLAAKATVANTKTNTVLSASDAAPLMPTSVFFKGQTASVQARNSGGVKTSDGGLVLVALVDSSGYSSAIQTRYQAYLLVDTAIELEGQRLLPGAYGCGFITDDAFVVMDLGGNDLFTVKSGRDSTMRRPRPLLVTKVGEGYRLYSGRRFVSFRLVGKTTH